MVNVIFFWLCYLIVLSIVIFAWSILISGFLGPPVVMTPKKIILEALAEVSPKKDQLILDLGSGSGRVLRIAAKRYQIKGIGYEINPFLIIWSRFCAFFEGIKNVEFKNENYLKKDLSQADIIYMYLLPKFIPKVTEKIEKECKKDTIVISQRFAVEKWERLQIKKIIRSSNSTYIYKL